MTTKLTNEQLAKILSETQAVITERHEHCTSGGSVEVDAYLFESMLTELQLLRTLESRADAEPVAWTDEQELRDVEKDGCGYLFTVKPITPNADPRRIIKLYTRPQPAPVVPNGFVLVPLKPTKEMLQEAEYERGADWQYAVDIWDSMCRAAMLGAAPQQEVKP